MKFPKLNFRAASSVFTESKQKVEGQIFLSRVWKLLFSKIFSNTLVSRRRIDEKR
ncbi:hypothetical protein LEP1GSC178_3678 [Leptospira licerasiae str. MMD4847]|uniref:Uncharacterized protein n=1 Tax=Leptospira licerasiae str. MMD4847 TaxID=1049971 RepID=A0ABP2RJ15_9LEPT|nr:hypothetical protein LEP1GSC178_3678 [Leptospira licerasiae str. MMD4847]